MLISAFYHNAKPQQNRTALWFCMVQYFWGIQSIDGCSASGAVHPARCKTCTAAAAAVALWGYDTYIFIKSYLLFSKIDNFFSSLYNKFETYFKIFFEGWICTMFRITISPDLNLQQQHFLAWGTSLCWWANVIGNWDDQKSVETICRLLFSSSDGLGINNVRYNLGAGELPPNKIHLRTGADVPCMMCADGTWNTLSDSAQQRILKQAVKHGVNFIEIFLNSPPLWMTKSHSTAGAVDGLCNLDESQLDALADYLVGCAEKVSFIAQRKVDSIAPFNEPLSFWWKADNNQEGCHFDVSQQCALIDRIHQRLSQRNLDISISAPECWSTYETIYACNHYSPSSLRSIGQINTHTYFSDTQSRRELCSLAKRLHKPLWMSEVTCGGKSPHSHNDMSSALELCENITLHLNEMEAVGWVYWQAVENEQLQHNHGLIHATFEGDETYYLTKQYYAFAQYSKFIRPGYVILHSDNNHVLLAKSSDSSQIVAVIFNNSPCESIYLEFLLPEPFTIANCKIYQTTQDYNLKESVADNTGKFMLPANSITTLIFESPHL